MQVSPRSQAYARSASAAIVEVEGFRGPGIANNFTAIICPVQTRPLFHARLHDRTTGRDVRAEVYGEIAKRQLLEIESTWQRAFEQRMTVTPLDQVGDEDLDWRWDAKAQMIADSDGSLEGYSIMIGDSLEGVMMLNVDWEGSSRHRESFGKRLVYVEYVATAPWNRPHPEGKPGRIRGVGATLLSLAAAVSLQEPGCDGRIGLHSLPGAEVFYHNSGLTDFGQDPAAEELHYFELSANEAIALAASSGLRGV